MNIEAAKARLAYALQRTMDDLAHDGRKWPVESETKNCDKCIGNWNCERWRLGWGPDRHCLFLNRDLHYDYEPKAERNDI